ncbi:16S rRNA (guanine(966)-N(2))-methyltransferase RsmD [Pajaroellobacter abortibovis]|uniref:16S rRNA (Guanine(966)-N(2))-methyltransferase RsmD n=1 Tax=Pajaroellobacter abortibovis TaxID=1882918 RepID=A0A1L6MYD4_9BACT|nr:16S rRNA (guanine(966)-N(2))-methyltransferase RsmD [Pajaroellobacter abortibovis]APS00540.1 16S rRNA (guanine(966)-N(2))-methyltransferase RsmD [Pajaroellobacter abortibovis]
MRIVGGLYRSRRLLGPSGQSVRPTSDRVREAAFSILEARKTLQGARVLDLYAGTGAFSLEALSRGADGTVMVESSRAMHKVIQQNLQMLCLASRASVLPLSVEQALSPIRAHGPFDFVLLDPPYGDCEQASSSSVIRAVGVAPFWVNEDALILFEHSAKQRPPALHHLDHISTWCYGSTALSLYCLSDKVKQKVREESEK